jgi:orotate phosphoribosyltransferase
MEAFDQGKFNQFVIDGDVIGFFSEPITLKSKRKSYFYANWRKVAADAFHTDRLAEFVLAFSQRLPEFDCLYGVPEGATKIAVISSLQHARSSPAYGPGSHALPMGRAVPKEHGSPDDRYFVGVPRGRTVILEDVTTTGGSLLNTIDSFVRSGLIPSAAMGLTDRMEKRDDGLSVTEAVKNAGLPYFSLSNALELLPLAAAKYQPSQEVLRKVEEEFEQYGVEKIRLR